MDFINPPNFEEGGYLYAYIVLLIIMLSSWFAVKWLQRQTNKVEEDEIKAKESSSQPEEDTAVETKPLNKKQNESNQEAHNQSSDRKNTSHDHRQP